MFPGQPYPATDPCFIIQNLGIHGLDIARTLFGEDERLSAGTARINPAIFRDDLGAILMDHAGGVIWVMDCSCATRREENFPRSLIEIDGTQGTLRLEAGYRLMRAGSSTSLPRPNGPGATF
ncbi:MAG: Gfo/Idh/MocA family oxidoreductase [Paracoccus hibiscisoli]|uniref:Gfo/Idh/MocA family protein n=1 Tax=Paracoccus hibiscisoli TaxID=2023261 RepID=UPI003919B755